MSATVVASWPAEANSFMAARSIAMRLGAWNSTTILFANNVPNSGAGRTLVLLFDVLRTGIRGSTASKSRIRDCASIGPTWAAGRSHTGPYGARELGQARGASNAGI